LQVAEQVEALTDRVCVPCRRKEQKAHDWPDDVAGAAKVAPSAAAKQEL
jgi:hypothetical protein